MRLNPLPTLVGAVVAACLGGLAQAQPSEVARAYAAPDAPIAVATSVPAGYGLVFVSGMTAGISDPSAPKGTIAAYGSTAVQTESALRRVESALQAQGLDFGDVVSMRVYLVGDPANGGAMDFKGMMAAYSQHFGTPQQPNRPSRTTVQVANLVAPGLLVEIETIAAKPPR